MKHLVTVVTAALLVLGASALAQQEHPEEHPEKGQPSAGKMTIDELAQAITVYIGQDAKLKGGHFLVWDAEEKKALTLQLDRVHKERLSSLGGGVYFACTDMKAGDGTVYDLDFFMKRTKGGIQATEVAVHKKAGRPRYGWKEENGVWKKVKS